MLLVLVDAGSKWLEVIPMTSTTAAATVTKLMAVFAAHGLPERVVTDNGPQFISQEFKDFMQRNGVVHIQVAPYRASSNGLAKRAVQTVKQASQEQCKSDCIGETSQEQCKSDCIASWQLTASHHTQLWVNHQLKS